MSLVITEISELLQHGDIADVRFLSFSGEVLSEPHEDMEDDDVRQTTQVLAGRNSDAIEVRMTITIDVREARYEATAGTQFRHDDDLDIAEDVVIEFAERIGVMTVYPFLREIISDMSGRLRQPNLTIPLLRAGQLNLAAETSPDDSNE
ncbi:hypothetical protein [Leifsonia shinshuensis]|uniref:Protein-export chaperone SecB n=1 Tax=Leifsonia shinshuensis TaxID=150026 RepID=A0A853D0E4_9MICO|nr:hypothetical protein [Leifsonia shinshuensis]NYJ24884.1 hypothetical protein [Leifsonia shinshuensis]